MQSTPDAGDGLACRMHSAAKKVLNHFFLTNGASLAQRVIVCSKAVYVVPDDVAAKDSGDRGLVGRVVPTNSGAGDDLKRGRRKSAYEGLLHIVRKVTVQRSGRLRFCRIDPT